MTLDYIFDFASPNAYLVHRVLPMISKRTGVDFNYSPCLLGGIFKDTGNQAPWQAFAHVPSKVGYEELEFKRFLIEHRIGGFTMNPHFPINTIALMRGACAMLAESPQAFMNYVDVIFKAMWEDGKNLGDPVALANVLSATDFDPQIFSEMISNVDIKEQLKVNTAAAVERGVFGIPTIFVGDEMFFGKERLRQVEIEIERQSA